MIRFASLGSGSKGNATLLQAGDTLVLLDCGYGPRLLGQRLARLGLHPRQLSAVVVTHEHGDHSRGVAVLAERYNIPVYTSAGTARGVMGLASLPQWRQVSAGEAVEHGEWRLCPVAVPHDAREPLQFVFVCGERRVGVLTDLGSLPGDVVRHYADCDALLLECNYDHDMLLNGPYPFPLKKRIASHVGHLGNHQAAELLERVDRDRLQHLVLGHLSETNNAPGCALEAIQAVFPRHQDITVADQQLGMDWRAIA